MTNILLPGSGVTTISKVLLIVIFHCSLRTFKGNSYPVLQSLDDIQKDLDPRLFFRLNSTHIMNVKAFVTAGKNAKKGLDVAIIHAKGGKGIDKLYRIRKLPSNSCFTTQAGSADQWGVSKE